MGIGPATALKRHFPIFLLILFMFCAENGKCRQWNRSSRLNLSWALDSNVFESYSNPLNCHTGRFFLELSGRGRPARYLNILLHYKGGVEGYLQHSVENRMIHDIKANCEAYFFRGVSSGITFQGRDKTFFRDDRGYRFLRGSPFIRWVFPFGLWGEIFYTFSSLDYTEGSNFDHRNQSIGLLFEFPLGSRIRFNLQYNHGTIKYQRQAFEFKQTTLNTYQWIDLQNTQRDKFRDISIAMEIYQWALIYISYLYQWNSSNSYGYSYQSPHIKLLIAKSFFWNLTLQLCGVLQLKYYTDSLQPFLQIRPDTEDEENSFFLINLTKDLTQNFSLRFQVGWYRNESPFRDRYYEKNLISMGFTQRF